MTTEFKNIEWTPDTVSRFWSFWDTHDVPDKMFFAGQHGKALLRLLGFIYPLKEAHVLDHGCGPGLLIPHLLSAKSKVYATDFSPRFVDKANRRFSGQSGWLGASLVKKHLIPISDSSVDVIICTEAIEHMSDESLKTLWNEFRRILAPNGYCILTTPNEEDLKNAVIPCAACGTVFHAWQHMRSWSSATLTKTLEDAGFQVRFCQGLHMARFAPLTKIAWTHLSLSMVNDRLRQSFLSFLDTFAPRRFPNQRLLCHLLKTAGTNNLVAVIQKHGSID